jgi:hypothetical protein
MSLSSNSVGQYLKASPYVRLDYEYTPKLNGGLYTGEAFEKNAPWGNVPIKPETGTYINQALKSANPPPLAQYHYPGAEQRPGNNTPELPGIVQCANYGFYAIEDDRVFSNDCLTYCSLMPKQPQC